jgi:hypothetical protein
MLLSFVGLRRSEADLLELNYRAGRWGRVFYPAVAGSRMLLSARLRFGGFLFATCVLGVVGCCFMGRAAR